MHMINKYVNVIVIMTSIKHTINKRMYFHVIMSSIKQVMASCHIPLAACYIRAGIMPQPLASCHMTLASCHVLIEQYG